MLAWLGAATLLALLAALLIRRRSYGSDSNVDGTATRTKLDEYLCLPCVDADFQRSLAPEDAIALLKDGVHRSTSRSLKKGSAKSRDLVYENASNGQWPYAAVLSCIDSRAPVEQIFDAGIGDLFVARVAGNTATPDLIASLEYTTKYAGTKAILVMGHTKCGAVKGAWAGLKDGHLTDLLARIQPAVDATKAALGEEASEANINACVAANVKETLNKLRSVSPIIAGLERERKIALLGAVYDVSTGGVSFMEEEAAEEAAPIEDAADLGDVTAVTPLSRLQRGVRSAVVSEAESESAMSRAATFDKSLSQLATAAAPSRLSNLISTAAAQAKLTPRNLAPDLTVEATETTEAMVARSMAKAAAVGSAEADSVEAVDAIDAVHAVHALDAVDGEAAPVKPKGSANVGVVLGICMVVLAVATGLLGLRPAPVDVPAPAPAWRSALVSTSHAIAGMAVEQVAFSVAAAAGAILLPPMVSNALSLAVSSPAPAASVASAGVATKRVAAGTGALLLRQAVKVRAATKRAKLGGLAATAGKQARGLVVTLPTTAGAKRYRVMLS